MFAIAALLVTAFVVTASWARSGYFVAFDETDEAIVWKGQTNGFLWFDPTRETPGGPAREDLTDESVARVERRPLFNSRSAADKFVRSLELKESPDSGSQTSADTTSGTDPPDTGPPPTTGS